MSCPGRKGKVDQLYGQRGSKSWVSAPARPRGLADSAIGSLGAASGDTPPNCRVRRRDVSRTALVGTGPGGY